MTRAAPYDRETALDAAMTLFWDKGFHATSLKDLEAALVMKPGSIYAAFSSSGSADPQRLARRFQSNVTALRLAMHQGMAYHDFEQLAQDMAAEIDSLRA